MSSYLDVARNEASKHGLDFVDWSNSALFHVGVYDASEIQRNSPDGTHGVGNIVVSKRGFTDEEWQKKCSDVVSGFVKRQAEFS